MNKPKIYLFITKPIFSIQQRIDTSKLIQVLDEIPVYIPDSIENFIETESHPNKLFLRKNQLKPIYTEYKKITIVENKFYNVKYQKRFK